MNPMMVKGMLTQMPLVTLTPNLITIYSLFHCLKKLSCRAEKWRKILKDLFLIEHILRTGNPRFADDLKDEIYKLKNLSNFTYYDDRADKGETSKL